MNTYISIIIPAYYEQDNIEPIYRKITEHLVPYLDRYTYEIIFIDDGSKDQTWSRIAQIADQDARVRGIKFSRNFGHQMALTAGYDVACGDAIISMDADLQDPPELLIPMICAWQQGAHMVYARRAQRKDGFLKKITAGWYYYLLSKVSDVHIPRHVGDFRLIDRKVLTTLAQCREKARYLRGMVAWTGFTSTYIEFERPNRHAGVTGYTWKKMIKLAGDGLTSFSTFPLRLIGYCGVLILGITSVMSGYFLYRCMVYGDQVVFMNSLGLIILGVLGAQSVALWILGLYVGRIYQESQKRPLYIVEKVCNEKQ
ncbi:glycosyltransferase family 2 protein [Candidatus Dependentiae bacterium]|nr:glycosyltransferase family 2 protein [Candidatus Dependentiae bacterium]